MIKVEPLGSLSRLSVSLMALPPSINVFADRNEPMRSTISVRYKVDGEYGARRQGAPAPGKPQDESGREKRRLIVTANQSCERTIGRFWRLNEEAGLEKSKDCGRKIQARLVLRPMGCRLAKEGSSFV